MHPACARFLAVASIFVGKVREDPPGSNRTIIGKAYGWDGQPYCDMGVSVCARRAGIPENVIPNSAYVPARWDDARRRGWAVSSPEPGDLAVMNFDGGVVDHIGIVAADASARQVLCIEFNTSPGSSGSQANGDGCWRRIRPRSLIEGFIRPPWHLIPEEDMPTAEEIASAVWNHQFPLSSKPNGPTESAGLRLVQAARGAGLGGHVQAILDAVTTLQHGSPVTLSSEQVGILADAIVARVGTGVAGALASELGRRLSS